MGLVNPSQSAAGEEINAADINDPINQLADVINGNIDSNNIATSGVATTNIADAAVTDAKLAARPSEYLADFIYSGGTVAQSAGLTGTFSNIVYYIGGVRYAATSVANKTYTASKDTYVDIGTDGTVDYNEVTNGAASPSLSASHIRVAKVVTNGSAITSVVQSGSDSLGNPIYNDDANRQNAWRSWTPTFTNLSGGTLNYAKYQQIGKTVNFRLKYTMAGANISGSVSFTPPAPPNSEEKPSVGYNVIGSAGILDSGVQNYSGICTLASTDSISVLLQSVGATYPTIVALSSTVPFTWGASDQIFARGSYEAA